MNEGTTYEIITPNEADPKGALIRKSGITADFTVAGMEGEQHKLEKIIKELKGKQAHAKSVTDNIEAHHPFVKDMSEQDMFTVHMYYESYALAKGLPEKIAEMEVQLEGSIGEQKLIAGALNIPALAERTVLEAPEAAPVADEPAPAVGTEVALATEETAAEPEAPVEEAAPETQPEAPADAVELAEVGQRVEFLGEGELAGFHTVVSVIPGTTEGGHAAYTTDRSTEPQKARNFRLAPEDVTTNEQA